MKKTILITFFGLLFLTLTSFSVHKFYVALYQVNYAPEKKMLQNRANSKHVSMTDYILLSALKQGNANNFLPVHIDRQSKNSA